MNHIENQIQIYAAEVYPNEACGLLVSKGKKVEVHHCRNISEDPKNRFTIDPHDYAAISDLGEIVGVWHSHPNLTSNASEYDIAACNAGDVPWYIVGLYKDENGHFVFLNMNCITPNKEEIPYIGRPYIYGLHDCFTLVVDYYKREFGIEIKERAEGYPYVENWQQKGLNLLADHEKAGFLQYEDLNPEIGDVFLIQTNGNVPDHIAIYIGDGQILHHCHGRLSTRDIFGGYWYKHCVKKLRHISKC